VWLGTVVRLRIVVSKLSNRMCRLKFSVLCFTAVVCQTVSSYAAPPADIEPESQAVLIFSVQGKGDFSFSAKLTLPQIPTNKGQYSIWILVGELKGSFALPAMLQVGLLWWKPDKYILQPFVGVEKSGGYIQTLVWPPLANGPTREYECRITRTRNILEAYIDSKRIFVAPWSTYFKNDDHLHLRIASEVLSGGDAVSGTVRHVELTTPKGTIEPYLPSIADEDRGVLFVCKDHTYIATGTFDAKKLTEPKWFQPPPCKGAGLH
jgi:hypothetical protein